MLPCASHPPYPPLASIRLVPFSGTMAPHAEFNQPNPAPVAGLQALYTDLELAIERVPIESLKTYKRQLRKHSKDQIEKLRASICCFGMVQPLLVDGSGELIGGHGLLKRHGSLATPRCRSCGSRTSMRRRSGLFGSR